jgi:xanthine dehydrogenase YagS FAD-binding subunit
MPMTITPTMLEEALALLAHPHHLPMGGGVDLTESLAEGVEHADEIVALGAIADLQRIETAAAGGLRIGGGVHLSALTGDASVLERYPLLADACRSSGPPEVLARATLAGNLSQRPRCPYFRQRVPCFKHGGDSCPAREGENRLLAILEGGPCFIVQRSDVASALVALEATIELASAAGRRTVAAGEFFVLPRHRLDRETMRGDDEMIVAVHLPAASAGGVQHFAKLADGGWGFALASVAAVRRTDGEVRLVLGGVAPRPYRVYNSIEEETTTGRLDEETIEGLAERALLDAEPLSGNEYKVELAAGLLRDAIRALSQAEP